MDAKTAAAFERLITAGKAHPLAFTLPYAWESDLRAILKDGLTPKLAREIVSNLDTAKEQARVKRVLLQLVSESDAKLILAWVATAVKAALGGSPAQDTVTTYRAAYKPAGEQQFFDGHLARAWDHPNNSDATIIRYLDGAARNGFTGIGIELCGHVPSFGGNVNQGGKAYKDAGGIISYHVKQVESARFALLLSECRKRNLWLWVMDINTNDKAMKGITSLSDVSRINAAMMKHGVQGVMRTAMNEDDGNTNAKLREDYENVVAGSMPDNQTISSFERESWAVYTDLHPSKIDKIKSYPKGKGTFVTSDNGTVIDEMTLGSTLGGDGRADIAQHVRFATEAQKIGASWCNYAFLTVYQQELQDALGKVISRDGGQGEIPTPDGKDAVNISRVEWVSPNKIDLSKALITLEMKSARIEGSNVRVDYKPPASWWKSDTDAMKFPRGIIAWESGGKVIVGHFDWFKKGQTVKTLGNVTNGYLKARPSVGQPIYFLIVSNDGRERTNVCAGGVWK